MSGPNDPYDPKQVARLGVDMLRRAGEDALAAFGAAGDLDALKAARLAHLGDHSPVALANREIGALPPQARADAGRRIGLLRRDLTQAHDERARSLAALAQARMLAEESVDVTLPYPGVPPGARHPLSAIAERVADIFVAMGYEVAEGPEAEAEWFNFDALNMPPDHPARELQDTIWLDPPEHGVLLRTQTSPVQARTLLAQPPPVYVVVPGRVYRNEAVDPTHSPVFSQVEGLAVDKGLTMAHLRGTLDTFATTMFGSGVATRFRPHYFPFTEPSAEFDLVCFACHGTGCRICSGEGWIEWGGCGMVNPQVLVACGVDPDRYTGFAFGMGLERTLMFRHAVTDIRDFFEGDVRFATALGLGG